MAWIAAYRQKASRLKHIVHFPWYSIRYADASIPAICSSEPLLLEETAVV